MNKAPVFVRRLGRMDYGVSLALQKAFVDAHLQKPDEAKDVLLLVEHPPVYTVGRRIHDYAAEERRLRALGADFYKLERGGQITFHGPGQLVGYPIINLRKHKPDLRWYVCTLEKALIRTCDKFGIKANTTPDTGVWVGNDKIAALGIHVQQWVTSHGFALNCDTDMQWFRNIVPCGLIGKGVTSLSIQTGRKVALDEAVQPFVEAFSQTIQRDMVFDDSVAPLE
eukprot:Colp12_sorted_trinity150504_noHs@34638